MFSALRPRVIKVKYRSCSSGGRLVDLRAEFLKSRIFPTLIGADGIHPTQAGHDLIHHTVQSALAY